MNLSEPESMERRLRGLRRSLVACWIVTTVAVLGTVAWAAARVRADVNDLLLPGPARQRMMAGVEARVRAALGPKLKRDAGHALRDLQPILLKDAQRVDAQASEVAQASTDALKKLRDDLPGVFSSRGFQPAGARPYQDQVTQIMDSLVTIRDQEAPNIRGVQSTWDMDLMVLEEMHREVGALRSATK